MHSLYTAEQSRQMDRLLIAGAGGTPIAGYELMCRAARACFGHLIERWPVAREIAIYAGVGNNGGDGYALGRLLLAAERRVCVFQVGDAERIRGEALQAREDYLAAQGEERAAMPAASAQPDLIVDAIFGSGLNKPLSTEMIEWIEAMNAHAAPKLAVDVPSGLNADTGRPSPVAVRADMTVSFITRKQGLYTGAGIEYGGDVLFSPLQTNEAQTGETQTGEAQTDEAQTSETQTDEAQTGETQTDEEQTGGRVAANIEAAARLTSYREVCSWLPARRGDTHKGQFGHVLVVGGNTGMMGAALLAAQAAMRGGSGLVSVATRTAHAPAMAAACAVLMPRGVEQPRQLRAMLERADAVVIGPGLGRDEWARMLLDAVLEANLPTVADADALHLLAAEPAVRERWVLTPHPGEAGALSGQDTRVVQQDRFRAVCELQRKYGGVCVLKGAGTLVCSSAGSVVCQGGHAGMSSAGMGDVLSGVIGSLLGQGYAPERAAILGVCLHAEAAARAGKAAPRGMIATDLLPFIRDAANP